MNKQEILITKKRMILGLTGKNPVNSHDSRVMTLQSECMRLGFILDVQLVEKLSALGDRS